MQETDDGRLGAVQFKSDGRQRLAFQVPQLDRLALQVNWARAATKPSVCSWRSNWAPGDCSSKANQA